MNTAHFMDKQIMDLSNSRSSNDFIDLMNPDEDLIGAGKKDEISPSYDFHPILPIGAPSQPPSVNSNYVGGGTTRASNSADSKTTNTTSLRNYGSVDSFQPAKVILEKDHKVFYANLLSEIDQTMKKHVDNLLHALEGVSARLSQLESRTRHLENSVDDLKVSFGNNHGSTDGKMRQLENILREVQNGVQVIRDKQEILDAQLQLAKVRVSKVEQVETQNTVHMDSMPPAASASQQSHQNLPPVALTQLPAAFPTPNAPSQPQNLPPPIQLPNQFTQNQSQPVPHKSYFPPPGQTLEAPNQQYHMTVSHQLQSSSTVAAQQHFQPPPHSQYSQPPPPHEEHPHLPAVNSPQLQPQPQPQPQPQLGHHPEEAPHIPSQNFSPGIHQPLSHPPSGAHQSQQFYGNPSHMYEPSPSRVGSGFSGTYSPSSAPGETYSYGGPTSLYGGGPPMKQQLLPSSAMGQSGGPGYPQLPTARILPHALPTASGVGGGSSPGRVPIDDVIDKVTSMGFPRDHVRATVRKLTENGQSVDLNVVLDKLMNDGEGQPLRGWFGR